MGVQKAYITMVAAVFWSASSNAMVIQASLDLGEYSDEVLQMMMKQVEMLSGPGLLKADGLTQGKTELSSALLREIPVVNIRGNITDPQRHLTITFSLKATVAESNSDDEDDDDEERWGQEWHGAGGVLEPLIDAVEPYVINLAELIVSSVLSAAISNLLDIAALA